MSSPIDAPPLFQLYPFDDSAFHAELDERIRDGSLPRETMFKLAAVGINETDEKQHRLTWVIVSDLIKNAATPEHLRPDTQKLLASPMPNAIIDWLSGGANAEVFASFESMYYRLSDLKTAIYENDPPANRDEDERRYHANAAARGLWRVLVNRHHPEWLKNPEPYYASRISYNTVYDAHEPTMRRRIVGHAVISDPIVFDTYSEAVEVGVKGIGPKGKESLRMLLSEEHPELL